MNRWPAKRRRRPRRLQIGDALPARTQEREPQ